MNILNGQQAFAEMAAGQKIECRHAGSDLDFDEIRNFPATVFIDQDYEFRIAVVYMTIGSMLVPESITESPSKGTQCFLPSILTEIKAKGFKWKNSDMDLSLLSRGLVHLYEENAITHANALIAVSQGSLGETVKVNLDDRLPWEQDEQNSASADIEEKTPPAEESKADPTSVEDQPSSTEKDLTVDELKQLQLEVEKLVNEPAAAEDLPKKDLVHEALLEDLLERAANANTPAEANALVGYTRMWTEEQRKPLLDAIHKRLNELNPPERAEAKEPPSLMVQIQNAKDLTELDCLEIEVSTRHVDIQPKLMGYVKRRRFELENQGSEAIQ
ncbi:hypothetical protein [Acinetobacter sp.]|uniref:hypothetical protein n=1 Tax=Acinetobacter sp. TaxID=472 RepID=UPI0035B38FD4